MAETVPAYRRWLPHVVAVLVFMLFSVCYFSPQYSGRAIPQSDVVMYEGMRHDIQEHRAQYGDDPQWTAGMFGGMPAYTVEMKYEGRLVKKLADALRFLGDPASLFFIAMIGFYIMLLCFGVNPWLAMAGGLSFGLSTYFYIIMQVGHITKMMAIAFAPPMIGAVWLAYRRNMWLGVALAGVCASIEISCSHPQITYYFFLAVAAMVVNEFVVALKEKRLPKFAKTSALLLVAGVLAVGSNASQLYYTYKYSKDSMRGPSELVFAGAEAANQTSGLDKEYATQWSYGKMETFNLFIPDLYGGSSSNVVSEQGPVAEVMAGSPYPLEYFRTYWGEQPGTSGPVYIGAVVIFFAVLGMFLVRGRNKWWIVAITALTVMLSWGKNFMGLTSLFLDYFPAYNKFRAVSMILVVAEWSLPLLAFLGLQRVWAGEIERKEFGRALKNTLYITGGVVLFFLILGGSLFSFTSTAESEWPAVLRAALAKERASMMRADAFRSLVFVLLSAGLVWAFYGAKVKRWVFVVLLSGLVLADMVPVNLKYLNHRSFVEKEAALAVSPTQTDLAIMADPDPDFRVLNRTVSTFNDATTSYFHKSIGGYHGAKLGRYQEMIDRYFLQPAGEKDPARQQLLMQGNMNMLNMLNTKYIIDRGEDGAEAAYVNDGALGHAWFVDAVKIAANANEELDAVAEIDPSTEAVVDRRFESQLSAADYVVDSTASIVLTDYRLNHLTYETSNDRAGLAVFSEIYYAFGWKAYLDGAEVPHMRADYILRAMEIPAGVHKVEFVYSAPNFRTITNITLLCSLLLIAGVAGVAVYYTVKKKK